MVQLCSKSFLCLSVQYLSFYYADNGFLFAFFVVFLVEGVLFGLVCCCLFFF